GIPDEKTGDAYLVPVDGKGTNTATCYSLNKLYTTLAATKAANSDGSHQPESRNFVEDNEA
ncbi:MAG: hypothetical protein IJT35_02875, partial [Paludibacteraceae bacterium]|nr:hypothetical protein [Paludibacteraceae bacterium]